MGERKEINAMGWIWTRILCPQCKHLNEVDRLMQQGETYECDGCMQPLTLKWMEGIERGVDDGEL